jgi:predicted outer membrane repeat protein
LVIALCIVAGLAAPARAEASVYTVDSPTDAADAIRGDGMCADAGGNCTLRAAIQEANVHPNDPTGPDEITIPLGTYTLTIAGANEDAAATGDLDITDNVKITGAGKDSTEVNGDKADRVFHNLSKTVEISGLTVKDGRAGSGGAFYNAGPSANAKLDNVRFTANEANGDGGAIFNDGTVMGTDSEFTNNKALSSFGGAITQYSGAANLSFTRTRFEGNTSPSNGGAINMNGTLVLKSASFTGNRSAFGDGGGVLVFTGHATIDDTTFAGNEAGGRGGGLYLNEITSRQSTITNSTFSGNKAGVGGGIYNIGQGTILTHVTVANNTATLRDTGGGIHWSGSLSSKSSIFAHNGPQNCSSNFISQGHNLSSDATCFAPGGTDRTGTDPKLGELADNGGPTTTLALQDGSPAIDAADNTNAPAFDQRGVSRPQDGDGDRQALHDIGAFEKEKPRDTEAPQLTVPSSPVEVEATDANGAPVNFANDVSASDNVDPNPSIDCTPASGSTFALGTKTVSCTAKDASGNESAAKSFDVKVQDTTAPVISDMPSDKTVEATGADGAQVSWTAPTATDTVDGNVNVNCASASDLRSGDIFPLGTTTVTCSATDQAHNSASGSLTVTVEDTTAPALTVPSRPVEVEATDTNGAPVNFANDVSASDAVDPSPAINCTPVSGTTFALGTTQVSCKAKDAKDNESDAKTFDVRVQDTTAPVISGMPSDITEEATSSAGTVVTYTKPTANDAVDPSPVVTCSPAPGSTFPVGSTTVSCTAKDATGNESAAKTFTVNVVKENVAYEWSGFLQPINTPTNMAPSPYTQSIFKIGSTVPVKFKLTGASAGISDGNFYLKYAYMGNGDGQGETEVVATATGSTGTQFRYDATAGQYIFNWSTKGITTQPGNYEVRVYTDSDFTNLLGSQAIELR